MELDDAGLEKYLEAQLRPAGLSDAQIGRLKTVIKDLRAQGIEPGSVFPYGIVVNDGAQVHADLDKQGLEKLLEWVGGRPGGPIERIEVFPKGIVVNDGFATRIRLR